MSNYSPTESLIRSGNLTLVSRHHNRPFLWDYRYRTDEHQKPIVIFVHGFKGFKDWGYFNQLADYLASAGFVVAKLNLSHNGTTVERPLDFDDLEAFGHNNFGIELDDLGLVTDTITGSDSPIPDTEADKSGVHLIGHSRGGSLVILKAGEDSRVKSVTTWAAVSDLAKRWPQPFLDEWKEKGVQYIPNARTGQEMPLYYQLVEDFMANSDRYNVPETVKNMSQQLLIIHGTEDTSVEPQAAHELHSWNSSSKLVLIEKADHVFGGGHPWEQEGLPALVITAADETIGFIEGI